ncbi:lysophospholipase L1-like esterase [Pedobacter sp. UYP30]|uniref:SGNH/GDSL hydrolase family protein n=1 Tax=Pedobacter sp. UYP30 TaxID=1756400 RepID=UPI0033919F72
MKSTVKTFLFLFLISFSAVAGTKIKFFKANNSSIQYVGRIDFSNKAMPKFWAPGVYLQATFEGKKCEVLINDEVKDPKLHNYITIVVDGGIPKRIQLKDKQNTVLVGDNFSAGKHTVLICKATEASIGYLEFVGIKCNKLLKPVPLPQRTIEFIGDSITCGFGADLTIPCGTNEWYDEHNAYLAYGPTTARALNAQWHLTAVSGIGLIHSYGGAPLLMPATFDKISLQEDSIKYNFNCYQPDVVSICLGQNDGIQDSVAFTSAYVKFINRLRTIYPKSTILCLTSPMADRKLNIVLQKYIAAVVAKALEKNNNVYKYFFSKQFSGGCGGHPDLAEHKVMASEVTNYIKQIKNW